MNNNENKVNDQVSNQSNNQNNQQPIYFGNSLSGSNLENSSNQVFSKQNQNLVNEVVSNDVNSTAVPERQLSHSLNEIQPEIPQVNQENSSLMNSSTDPQQEKEENVSNQEEKKIANLKNDMLSLAIINVIILGLLFYTKEYKITTLVIVCIDILCLLIGYNGAKEKKESAGVIGIIAGILMVLSGSIVDILLGIFLLVHAIQYNKVIKKNSSVDSKKRNSWKSWVLGIFVVIVVLILAVLIDFFIEQKLSTLQCTRSNGDQVVVQFNEDGISKMTINGEVPNSSEYLNYKLNFASPFIWIKISDEDVINKYKEKVKEYEETKGAVCK